MVRLLALLIMAMVAAMSAGCGPLIPARTPVQLDHTPGPPIRIDAERISGANWQVDYPPGWKIVRINTADEPLRLVFVSPDEDAADAIVITISEAPFPDSQRVQRQGVSAYIHSESPPERSAERLRIVERIVASLRPI